ncbi:ornithine cyclodeaminase [Tistlia consotensis]|uniref:Ornithine cyclodeaminase n=1 Tax=Tistlia consotensis USBA 355 TaxID=560819 RepID=A0A1Y6CE83_9PROT|nr:cyclodeaminase [Tistlia consotensis]SMF56928.1 ornithine cyclodeaminase [Tistlia consotensis USBA 355]SNR45099.1 ornithine cyclodeaminase [Tistlia consotensis]
MPRIRILTEADLRGRVTLDLGLVELIEQAFAALATRAVVMPPILSMEIAERHGEVDVKTAYVPGLDGFAIKISPGFFDNPKLGLPSLNGLMVLLSAETGIVQAVLLDNGYLTDIRTAAAGAVAAKHLAPRAVRSAAVLGAGLQAELQIQALALVRPFGELLVWARDPAKAEAYAEKMAARLGIPVRTVPSAEEAVAAAQVVVTTTPSREPLIRAEWLHPGLHVTAMGSDAAGKNELDPAVLARADLLVCDRVGQCATLGELRAAIAAGLLPADHAPPELGQVIAGLSAGRTTDDQITVADLTGTGIQDTAIATAAFQRCAAAGVGQEIET